MVASKIKNPTVYTPTSPSHSKHTPFTARSPLGHGLHTGSELSLRRSLCKETPSAECHQGDKGRAHGEGLTYPHADHSPLSVRE